LLAVKHGRIGRSVLSAVSLAATKRDKSL